ncbi:MAG: hypothetical protein ACOWYE_02320 [Desulfatiglandales bacterium]
MKKQKTPKEMTLTGFVTPEEWDTDDNVIAIGISTEDDDYLVELNKVGEELFDFLDEDVEVTGLVTEDKDGTKHITLTSYEVLHSDDFEEDEDYGDYDYDDDTEDSDSENERYH